MDFKSIVVADAQYLIRLGLKNLIRNGKSMTASFLKRLWAKARTKSTTCYLQALGTV